MFEIFPLIQPQVQWTQTPKVEQFQLDKCLAFGHLSRSASSVVFPFPESATRVSHGSQRTPQRRMPLKAGPKTPCGSSGDKCLGSSSFTKEEWL